MCSQNFCSDTSSYKIFHTTARMEVSIHCLKSAVIPIWIRPVKAHLDPAQYAHCSHT